MCRLAPGEVGVLTAEGLRLPDGALVTDTKSCVFEVGSTIRFHYEEEEPAAPEPPPQPRRPRMDPALTEDASAPAPAETSPVSEDHAREAATTAADATSANDLATLAKTTGGDNTLTIALALLAVVGGAAGWKFWTQLSAQRHEQAMERLKMERDAAGLGGAQPPPCAAKQAEMDARMADLSARLDAAMKKTATLSADFDGEDLERQVKRLSKTVKSMQQGGV